MAIYQLSDSKPFSLLIGDDAHPTLIEFACRLQEAQAPFQIFVHNDAEALQEFKDHVCTTKEDLQQPIDVFVDFSTQDTRDNAKPESPLQSTDVHALVSELLDSANTSQIVLSANAFSRTSTLVRFFDRSDLITRFNGLPGFFEYSSAVELAPTDDCRPEILQQVSEYFSLLKLTTEVVGDRIGFVAPRILAMIINEAAFSILEGVSDATNIDAAMRLGTNYPKGPCQWADEIGIDRIHEILENLYNEYRQERYRPCILLQEFIQKGWLGKSSGRGFYAYDEDGESVDS